MLDLKLQLDTQSSKSFKVKKRNTFRFSDQMYSLSDCSLQSSVKLYDFIIIIIPWVAFLLSLSAWFIPVKSQMEDFMKIVCEMVYISVKV